MGWRRDLFYGKSAQIDNPISTMDTYLPAKQPYLLTDKRMNE